MFKWIRQNWFMSMLIGAVIYTIHILIEYVLVDAVLKFAGISLSIV